MVRLTKLVSDLTDQSRKLESCQGKLGGERRVYSVCTHRRGKEPRQKLRATATCQGGWCWLDPGLPSLGLRGL